MILVTGATGTVGRQVVAQLRERGEPVRAVARHPESAGLPAGVEVVRADLADPSSLGPHLAGVDAVFLLWPFTSAEQSADAGSRLVQLLARSVGRIVYLSAQAAQDQPGSSWAVMERLIEGSGTPWTFLEPAGFAANTLMWAGQVRDGVVRWPYGAAARSLVDERDIAAVAVAALTGDGHAGRRYVLTGPDVITQADQVRVIGEAAGREVRWAELPPDDARRELTAAWGDAAFAASALESWAAFAVQPETVTKTVEEVTGTRARSFQQWAADHVDDFFPPSPAEVADRYVAAFRAGDLAAAVRLLAPAMIRVAPLEAPDGPDELHGAQVIMDNGERHNADYEMHSVEVGDPLVRGDQFAVRFAFDRTHRPTGRRAATVKMSLYTVAGSAVTREEVYYLTPAVPAS